MVLYSNDIKRARSSRIELLQENLSSSVSETCAQPWWSSREGSWEVWGPSHYWGCWKPLHGSGLAQGGPPPHFPGEPLCGATCADPGVHCRPVGGGFRASTASA